MNTENKYYYGLPNYGAKAKFLFDKYVSQKQNAVFVSNNEEDLETLALALQTWAQDSAVSIVYLSSENLLTAPALAQITETKNPLIITMQYEDLELPLPGKKDFADLVKTIKPTDTMLRQELINYLAAAGYSREEFTETHGEFAVRGSIVDIFVPGQDKPVRLYFAGNKIETISEFDIDTQNTHSYKDSITILPIKFEELHSNILNWAKGYGFVFDDPASDFDLSVYENASVITPYPTGENYGLNANIKFNANIDLFAKEVNDLKMKGFDITVFCLNRGEQDRLEELLHEKDIAREVTFKIAPITQGFYDTKTMQVFITSSEILNRSYHTSTLLKNYEIEGAKRVRFKELNAGDYVVHQVHGIGKYLGLQVFDEDTNPTDCLVIEFRKGSKLFVPMQDFGKVQKYIGVKGKMPPLSHLGGTAWKEVKRRVREAAQKDAQEILKMEALRASAHATPMFGDPHLEAEFADSFPFTQTPDQTQAIGEILTDLTMEKSMDRVLVGDVGFGKTEVAIRAALRAALANTQVLVLVPTTILAAQHYKTFSKRLVEFPATVEMLSRFQTKAEQKKVVKKIKDGTVDIVVGTHRLLSKDINFKNLGLVIIDEEHRFGVKQKEKIKAKAAGVHTLMLSATPIPRTLNQSLTSIRDLSIIETPPQGRMPVKTVVSPWSQDLISHAVRSEIARGGQVYYVYNRVMSMEARLALLKKILPEMRICMAHGQMDEKVLEETLWDFYNQKYDILLASTIIESGLDISNANTLIVEDAQNFGLAQLYQLRGRIGRGDRKAYCYLFHPDWMFTKKENVQKENSFDELIGFKVKKEKDPTEDAKKRLGALIEFGELGSGFKLAMRDMEIRGAGDLLGTKQHGFANEVGLSLYVDMVSAEVKKLKGIVVEKQYRATINMPVPAYIPPEYLPDDNERLRFYKELMNANETEQEAILLKMQDLCGPLPLEVIALSKLMLLSNRAGKLGVRAIDITKEYAEFYFAKSFVMPDNLVPEMLAKYGAHIKFIPSPKGDGLRIFYPRKVDADTALSNTQDIFAFIRSKVPAKK
ncbi:transcription-repair coupling factor (superfamily II helicase) [Elusimicrobium posterum]|uniref:DEAD/DEAH box helicase n=1 Tax=Elusimicrobium posterum TaxID=3116653 RepID=UPI003C789E5B